MEIYLDTANTDYIEKYLVPYNLSGVTCNPSILAKDKQDWEVLAQLVKGDKKLFVQVLATDTEGMVKEALKLREKYDIIIKVPCSSEGYKAMVQLKKAGVPILATAIYSPLQAILAAQCGVDYVAPYVNRMSDSEQDGVEIVSNIQQAFDLQGLDCKIVAASFKNLNQISTLLIMGVYAVTLPVDLFEKMIANPLTEAAVVNFTKDWKKFTGRNTL